MMSGNRPSDRLASLANQPPTPQQLRIVFTVAALLTAGFFVAAAFADLRLPQSLGAIVAVQTAIFINLLLTAVLLFAHYAVSGSRALSVLASGYLLTALIIIPYTLSFPGAFAPAGLIGGDLQTTPWLYWFWHFAQISTALAYALLKNRKDGLYENNEASIVPTIIGSLVVVAALVCGIVWIAVAKNHFLPAIIGSSDSLENNAKIVAYTFLLLIAAALVTLWLRRQIILDYWLMLMVCALLAETIQAPLLITGRFQLGWYAARVFSFLTSIFVLLLLIAQVTRLYAHLARTNATLVRERSNKMLSIHAATSSIIHEVRQPLTGITARSSAARRWLRHAPPNVSRTEELLGEIESAAFRANDVLENVRRLFQDADYNPEPIDVNTLARAALQILDKDLSDHGIRIDVELGPELPHVMGHSGQLQEVFLNLIHNAIDAMASVEARRRALRVRTRPNGGKTIVIDVEDSGQGIEPERLGSIFEAFVTTKPNGTGLGLAICSRIIERHGGQLTASSDGKSGALFQIALPVASATTATDLHARTRVAVARPFPGLGGADEVVE
jgi:signal transduction histidine kinase